MSIHRSDRGQATPLWAVVLVLAGLLLVPTGLLVRATVQRAEARSAADAAALAGALEGEDAARSVAEANGGELIDYQARGDLVEVTVMVGDRRATARAERSLRLETPSPPDR
ncbi:pilus assembly protein TadG-related protein [Acidimicrobiia bacterium EGI L10123]|uniref:pilus assembly protein TadG-related protein n=1 Tax=Salinilacustrithrix flava TaxID=2957203 RepID=UPI003D7C187D|nr:pilus assembly protein TadG-related protein [Acidimicrobiia bacterium EGI L10123]